MPLSSGIVLEFPSLSSLLVISFVEAEFYLRIYLFVCVLFIADSK